MFPRLLFPRLLFPRLLLFPLLPVLLGVFSATVAPVWGQSPTPEQVEQAQEAVRSGAEVTPGMIESAREQFPELREYSEEDIQRRIAEERKAREDTLPDETVDETDELRVDEAAEEDEDEEWASSRRRGIGGTEGERGASRFPSGLRRFGHDFFRNADAGAGLGANAPSLPDYMLSPGDEIQVYTWGRDSRNVTVTLDKEGMFRYPPLAPLRVAGLKFADAQELITKEIEKIHGITAAVSLGRLRSIRVMVLGEAVRPGSYVLPAGITVTAALFRSGGVSSIGSLRDIEVRRDGEVAARLDVYEMLLRGEARGDVQLLPGDAIFIPLAGRQVAVQGHVKRPAIYEVPPGFRALEAVELAGGLKSEGFRGRLRLDRVQDNKRNIVLDVDMEEVNANTNVPLEDGDILFVDRVLDQLEDVVFLQGNVDRPGRYQFKPGMTVRDLVPSPESLKPETFFEYGHIRRPAPDDDRPTLLNFSLDAVLEGEEVPLQPRDVVVIYNRYNVMERPSVGVSGAVRRPGEFMYREGMNVSDLVILGGGLRDAHLSEAHLRRQVIPPGEDTAYTELIRLNLRRVLEDPRDSANLELQPYDALSVLPRSVFQYPRSVAIYGSVRNDGSYALADQMGIPDLVKMAGGLTKNSYRLNVEVVRRELVADSVIVRTIDTLNLSEVLEEAATFELRDGDRLYVRDVINAREATSVTLAGEFRFPGVYEFVPGEKLSSVIERAGGFTDEAYLRAAVFVRESVREQQLRHAEEVGRRLENQLQARMLQSTDEAEQAGLAQALNRGEQLVEEISRAPYLGRVVVNIDRDMEFAGTDWDVELEHGDRLRVGPRVSTVSVLGEVASPTTVVHTRENDRVGEVLASAGGVNAFGDFKNIYYIGPDGNVSTPRSTPWYSSFNRKKVEPGGTVVVPLKPPAKDYLEIWAQSTQILYQLAISVGVAKTLF